MNCKPGDLAVVIGVSNPLSAHHVGMVVEVLSAAPEAVGSLCMKPDGVPSRRTLPGAAWVCKKPYPAVHWSTGRLSLYGIFYDRALRPLKDPDQTIVSEETLSV